MRTALAAATLLLLVPAAAPGATLDAVIAPQGAGARLALGLRPDPAHGAEVAGQPLVLDFAPEVVLGRDAGAPGCPAEQVLADEAACPAGSRVGDGAMDLATPAGARTIGLAVFAAPGGAALELLANGNGGRRVVTAEVGPGRSRVTVPWSDAVAAGGGGAIVSFTLRIDAASAWVTTTGCSGPSWVVRATMAGDSAADDVACTAGSGAPAGDSGADVCAPAQVGVRCIAGNGRTTPGGGDKVSHAGWPAITGRIAFADDAGRAVAGTALSDELLGGAGSDSITGGDGDDVLWGAATTRQARGTRQRDRLSGGAGDDFLYASHGRSVLGGGPGDDVISAYFAHGISRVSGGAGDDVVWERSGRGTIDCGPGRDTVHARAATPWRLRDCERVIPYNGAAGPR
ncbi:MAG TPA: calcium-binding protein [Solirubrobacteraceae bacterium]|jgi:Ca2+-binding RTX toxin-like protein